ncbi:MAG TPA: hypothetical protein VMD30_09110 [Tepidisphaeraceae bacterium]|nr:hypothetical protein [Tepidisphaeraceae bacterium]
MQASSPKLFFPLISFFCLAVVAIFSVVGWGMIQTLWGMIQSQL